MSNCKVSTENLGAWLASPQGHYVLEREQAYFDRAVGDIFGFNAIQIGLPEYDFLRMNRMPLHINNEQVNYSYTELPFECESMDLLLLPHVLEFSQAPHQILREVEKVLMPEGNLIISGFNPISLWGVNRVFERKRGFPWCGEFISLTRLKDWLALMGFEVVEVCFAVYAPPFLQSKWLDRCAFMETAGDRWWAVSGGVYFVHAIKRVPGMRVIRPRWKKGLVRKLLPATPKLHN